MGFLSKIAKLTGRANKTIKSEEESLQRGSRLCRFESMEPRRMLAADLLFGAVYFEEATGDDSQPDVIEVTFEGGAPGTQLTELRISGDKHGDGDYTIGDVFFDTTAGGEGVFASAGVQILSQDGFDIVGFTVVDGGTDIVFHFDGFDAGEKLVFSTDVDEVSFIENDGSIDATSVVEGGEFQRSKLTGVFQATHYETETLEATFWDFYDTNFANESTATGLTLDLPPDQYSPTHDFTDRTAGAIVSGEQVVIPASISGYVYHDRDNDGLRDAGEEGIADVRIQVIAVSTIDGSIGVFETQTNADGYYEVDGLVPGEYRVVEAEQPSPFLDGKDTPGTVGGTTRGVAVSPDADELRTITLNGGDAGVEYNFGEVLPSSISGRVHADPEGDCEVGPNDILLEGVRIDLLDASGNLLQTTYTNAQGEYRFDDLPPGEYKVYEHQPDGYYDGDDHVGTAGGILESNDTIAAVMLTSGTSGENYDFCENLGAKLSGYVYHDRDNDGSREAGEEGIAQVTLKLLDENGDPVLDGAGNAITATTNGQGYYEFTNLDAGKYRVMEIQPQGWLDGLDTPGSHGGSADNPPPGDMISGAMLDFGDVATEYNFGEVLPSSISGRVHADPEGDCEVGPNDILLEGVRIDLLDANGNLLQTTFTNAQGEYRFDDLPPGEYKVYEHQPTGYHDGDEHVGTAGGVLEADDTIGAIMLTSGTNGQEYDFCENVGVDLSGYVYHDRDNDGNREAGEEGIRDVTLKLLDAAGNAVKDDAGNDITTVTDANGFYQFTDLEAGTYSVMEVHPADWLDGIDTPGNHGGTADPSPPGDMLSNIVLPYGDDGVEYNFGELLPGKIHGSVYVDTDQDCIHDADEPALEGVRIDLLDAQGNVIATTTTDADGEYWFMGLRPGTYSVREHQPDGYFEGGEMLGSGGGVYTAINEMGQIEISSGDNLVDYDFKELPPAAISGYVYQDGDTLVTEDGSLPANLAALRDGQRTSDDTPLGGVVLELRNGVTGEVIDGSTLLPGVYGPGPVQTITDANGYYEFIGLPPGNYAVYEIQPTAYIDWVDSAGDTGGVTFNHNDIVNPFILFQLGANDPAGDAIIRIAVSAGQTSANNNFSEVLVMPEVPEDPPEDPPLIPPSSPDPVVPASYLPPLVDFPVTLPLAPTPDVPLPPGLPLRAGAALGYTWHLSVVDAGQPRAVLPEDFVVQLTSRELTAAAWADIDMTQSAWIRRTSDGELGPETLFGSPDGLPVTGDFNGDGITDVGVFVQGHWFIDVNGNGRWDEGDLWAKLGTGDDLPVTGDWDGDGKTDIGIFGPAWAGDPKAIERDPGLPDPANERMHDTKNLPPLVQDATLGGRVMKLTSQGKPRQDLIDHVFAYGTSGDIPITGDWNGDGIDTIGVFRNGAWHLDVDGDGRLSDKDIAFQYGGHGDLPVVGDFNGDGIDEIGVYRAGTWFIDADGNRQFAASDEAFSLGTSADLPAVGDWDGDGVDEPAVYKLRASTPRADAS